MSQKKRKAVLPKDCYREIAAPPATKQLLNRLVPGRAGASDLTADEATEYLAHIAWARLAEPGDRVAAALIQRLGAVSMLALLVSGASAKKIVNIDREISSEGALEPRAVSAALKRWTPRLDRVATENDIERALSTKMQVLIPQHVLWPKQVNDLGDFAPLMLWTRGNPSQLSLPSIAFVGARACSSYGEHITAELTAEIVSLGYTVISGAAYGIDAVAHRAALAAGGLTTAMLAGGADRNYPRGHAQLLSRISREGVVCSEMIPGAAPTRWRFLQRNRLISALATATVVTEAGIRSGSLNTAGHSAQLGRRLGAVPGPVTSPSSTGCHKLIRDYNATLISSAADLREMVAEGTNTGDQNRTHEKREPAHHQRVVDSLPLSGARSLSEISRRSGLSTVEVGYALSELELLQTVARTSSTDEHDPSWRLVHS